MNYCLIRKHVFVKGIIPSIAHFVPHIYFAEVGNIIDSSENTVNAIEICRIVALQWRGFKRQCLEFRLYVIIREVFFTCF